MKSDLLDGIKSLKKLYNASIPQFNPKNAEPVHIRIFLDDISKRVDGGGKLEPNIDLNELLEHARSCFDKKQNDFNKTEINNLPFILFMEGMDFPLFRYLVNDCIDCSRESRLLRLIYIFFSNYNDSNEISLIKQKIFSTISKKTSTFYRKKTLKCMWDYRNVLFQGNALYGMRNLYKSFGLNDALDRLGFFNKNLRTSGFVYETLKFFFEDRISEKKKYEIFEELTALKFVGLIKIKPVAVSSLIILTDKRNDNEWKEKLISFCTNSKNFGDPRLNRNKWLAIDPVARKIFLQWLASNDLELFFKIIEKSAIDRMWKYRSKFWKAYLPYISRTWVFFGSIAQQTAKQIANDRPLAYGRATTGASSNHSAFLFEIGDYVFCEWSHNGRLYIWQNDSYAVKRGIVEFGGDEIRKNDLTNSGAKATFTHSYSEKYYWQEEVSDWIAIHCNITKTKKDWSL